ncbi:DNA-binding protein [Burkholderia ambifaria]|uniref:DNA-binding protein n=1 Tax=Burkholderia ambifaria TaxID=152480 RepID=UPI001B916B06|nr:DNA-binding protein [Burkholderia ambifaria]MBR8066553.1 DNA-binding protein [Burkholderia ambifaria]
MKELITVEQLSAYLHKSVASIRSDATRNPQSLPPICRLPSTKRLLWRVEDVERWLAAHVEGISRPVSSVVAEDPRARRGRPTKAEQIARQRSQRHKQSGIRSSSPEAAAEV